VLAWLKEWSGIVALAFGFFNLLLSFGLTRWAQGQTATRDYITGKLADIRQLAEKLTMNQQDNVQQNVSDLRIHMVELRDRALQLRGSRVRAEITTLLKPMRGGAWRVDDMSYPARRIGELQIAIANAPESSLQSNDGAIWQQELGSQSATVQQSASQILTRANELHTKLTTRDRYPFHMQAVVGASGRLRTRVNEWLSRYPDELD
jgi:hypothetical protein